MRKKFLITGGSGFIGTNMINFLSTKNQIVSIDVAEPTNYNIKKLRNFKFFALNICENEKVYEIIRKFKPNFLINFAAESHVDKSIDSPKKFIDSNVNGVLSLLTAVKKYNKVNQKKIKFIQISTDEVYGDIEGKKSSNEIDILSPSSPYSASKASADLIINSFIKTYNFPAIILRLCNNYGFYQNPEKLIPRIILKILNNRDIPIYGDGRNQREWIFVKDACKNIYSAIFKCRNGQTYNIGTNKNKTNLEITYLILKIFKEKFKFIKSNSRIKFVKDRPGHDMKYLLNSSKIKKILKLQDSNLEKNLTKTCKWYIENREWIRRLNNNYEKRIGLDI
jgi:dTDP-glucose 4,6-dehydratase